MPPSRNARHTPVSFRDIDPTDWEKLEKIFPVHGVRLPKLTLGDGTEITTDDCVQIASGDDFSETSAPNEVWFAEVLDIKSDNKQVSDREEIFVRIRWFYTPYSQRAESILRTDMILIKPHPFTDLDHYRRTVGNSKNEVVLSNHMQVIPAIWIVRKVRILCFNEEDKSNRGDYIGPKDRWYRYHFKIGWDRIVTRKNQMLPPAGCGLSGCGLRYSPDEEVQRFCPRWLCRQWWHEECLRNREFVQPVTPYSLLHMIHGTPGFRGADDAADDETPVDTTGLEVDEEFDHEIATICSTTFEELGKLERDVIRIKDFEDKNLALPLSVLKEEDHYRKIEKILWCARSPIVRGKEHGVVGTGDLVTKARNILKHKAESGTWLDLSPDILALFNSCRQPIFPIFTCPTCGGAF
ncbi:hypothetical protein B0J17DRAFT_714517 [Rhizoctonia solani]|nr:hypothetical protein B0J17DRAFT_714517 [Rhizoctonia solani]